MNRLFTALLAAGLLVATTAGAAQRKDTFKTKSGKDVTITCIKHGSVQITYDGREFYVDPEGTLKPVTINYSQWPKAHFILITHEHHDHFDREAIAALRTPVTAIYTNEAVYGLFHNGIMMHNGDSISIDHDIQLKAVPAYNTTEGREQFHPKGRDNGYVLTLDGLRIYFAGDTENIPEMAELHNIDIAFLPCNQPYTMTVDQLVSAAKVIKPKVLFPYHYGNTPIVQSLMKLSGSGIDVRIRDYK